MYQLTRSMARSLTLLVFLAVMLCWTAGERSHDVWLTRADEAELNPKWVVDETLELHKVDRNRKSLDMNFTLKQEVKGDAMVCSLKVYQKNGAKYSKAPFNIRETSCCELINKNGLAWRCIREKSNAPESCPIAAGFYYIKDFDPYLCDYPKNLPPNGAEQYKIEFTGAVGGEQVFKHVAYGVMKKTTRF